MPQPHPQVRWLPFALSVLVGCTASASALAVDLMGVYNEALRTDPVYRSAGAGNLAAQEFIPQARAGLLPEVAFGAGVGTAYQDVRRPAAVARTDDYGTSNMTLSVTQPIYRRDRWIAIGQAESRVQQSDLTYALARQALMIRVAVRYFDLLSAQDDVNFANANRDAIEPLGCDEFLQMRVRDLDAFFR